MKVGSPLTTIYLLPDDYVRPDPVRTIQALGHRLCQELKRIVPEASDLEIPTFEDALGPLGEFLTAVVARSPVRLLVMLASLMNYRLTYTPITR